MTEQDMEEAQLWLFEEARRAMGGPQIHATAIVAALPAVHRTVEPELFDWHAPNLSLGRGGPAERRADEGPTGAGREAPHPNPLGDGTTQQLGSNATALPHDEIFLESPSDEAYFLLIGDEALGPFTVVEIRDRLEDGRIDGETYAWNQTLDEWIPLGRLLASGVTRASLAPVYTDPPPEQPASELAEFVPRFLGGLADLGIIVLAFLAAMVAVPPFRAWIEASSTDPAGLLQSNLILSVLSYAYFMLFLGPPGRGRTPGYRLLRLSLVDQETRLPPSWLQAFLWCAGSVVLLAGWIFFWFDRQKRMLHNGISGTIVLRSLP